MAGIADSIDLGDISKMKVADLKKELKLRGLDSNGNKSQLVQRLQSAVGEIADTDSMLADADEILDDDVLADETLEDEIDDMHEDNMSPELPRSTKRKSSEKASDTCVPLKKITLNRMAVVSSSDLEVGDSQSEGKANGGKEGSNVIKLSDFSAQERLEKRAAKFGGTADMTPDARKQARAIRFGSTSSTASISNSLPINSLEQLKKRSERFGTSVSTVMTKLEEEEKLKKRRERFGIVEPNHTSVKPKVTSSTLPSSSSSAKVPITFSTTSSGVNEEKKRLRAERFKIKT